MRNWLWHGQGAGPNNLGLGTLVRLAFLTAAFGISGLGVATVAAIGSLRQEIAHWGWVESVDDAHGHLLELLIDYDASAAVPSTATVLKAFDRLETVIAAVDPDDTTAKLIARDTKTARDAYISAWIQMRTAGEALEWLTGSIAELRRLTREAALPESQSDATADRQLRSRDQSLLAVSAVLQELSATERILSHLLVMPGTDRALVEAPVRLDDTPFVCGPQTANGPAPCLATAAALRAAIARVNSARGTRIQPERQSALDAAQAHISALRSQLEDITARKTAAVNLPNGASSASDNRPPRTARIVAFEHRLDLLASTIDALAAANAAGFAHAKTEIAAMIDHIDTDAADLFSRDAVDEKAAIQIAAATRMLDLSWLRTATAIAERNARATEMTASLRAMGARISDAAERIATDTANWIGRFSRSALAVMIGLGLVATTIGLTGYLLLGRPIARITDRLLRLAEGHLDDPVSGGPGSPALKSLFAAIETLRQSSVQRVIAEIRATEAAKELEVAHQRLNNIADNAPAGLFEFRGRSSHGPAFPYTSTGFDELLGWDHPDAVKSAEALDRLIHPDDLANVQNAMTTSLKGRLPWHSRFRIYHPQRGTRWIEGRATLVREPEGGTRWVGTMTDITDAVAREKELERAYRMTDEMRIEVERQALHDAITELPNRRYFDRVLGARMALARSEDEATRQECVLVRLDLDHFKFVNDTLGHEAGDNVLIHVARILRREIRTEDFAARVGGDEFSILLAPGAAIDNARALVDRLFARLEDPLMYHGRQCRFGASFGIASTATICETEGELLSFADAALYRAKECGRNRVEVFTTGLHEDILRERRLATEIQEALERDEFVPYYQPQVLARDGSLAGVEVLARWNHSEHGLLAPGAFIDVADQVRMVPEIDRQMFEKSRQALARWRERGLTIPKISFNVSSGRMLDPDIITAAHSVAQTDTQVTFELLESILIEGESDAFRFHLDQISEAGIDIEIDDFGSGHASIIGLMSIAPKALKIDRRIVDPVDTDAKARKLVGAIVEIASAMNIGVVAEGVETAEHARILRDLGCDVFQGFYFAGPLSEADFIAFAEDRLARSA